MVDLAEVAHEISVRLLQETLYTHKQGFRLLLAPEECDGRPMSTRRSRAAC